MTFAQIIADAIERQGSNKSEIARKIGVSSQLLGQYEKGQKEPKMGFFARWKKEFGEDLYREVETKVYNISGDRRGIDAVIAIENDKDPSVKEIMLVQLKTFERQSDSFEKQTLLMEAILKMMDKQGSQAEEIKEKVRATEARTDKMDANLDRVLTGVEVLSQDSEHVMKTLEEISSRLPDGKILTSRDSGKRSGQTLGAGKKLGKTRG